MKKPETQQEAQAMLVQETGKDCYSDGILFKGDADREAFAWLCDVLKKLGEANKPNSEKAQRVTNLLHRIIIHGFIDHTAMHVACKLSKENAELKEVVSSITVHGPSN